MEGFFVVCPGAIVWVRQQTTIARACVMHIDGTRFPGAVGPHKQGMTIMKKSRGGRMTAAKKRAAKSPGGVGLIKNRPAGKKIMKT